MYVLVYDKQTYSEYLWTKAKFLNRQSYMQDMYSTFEYTGSVPRVSQVTEALALSMLQLKLMVFHGLLGFSMHNFDFDIFCSPQKPCEFNSDNN